MPPGAASDRVMLIAQLNFEMENLFAIADKTEMPGFNHACMYGTNAHFVQFFAFDFIKWIIFNFLILVSAIVRIAHWF